MLHPRRVLLLCGLLIALTVPVLVSAQRGGTRPVPSRTAGASFNAVTRAFSTPAFQRSGTPLATWTPQFSRTLTLTPSPQAEQAIITFASDQLGIVVVPLYAGDLTADIQTALQALPAGAQADLSGASTISGALYWALFANGAAGLAVGDCTDNPNCTIDINDLRVQLSSASAGLYSQITTQTVTTAQDALSLIEQTYPKLSGLPFSPSDVHHGFAFNVITTNVSRDPTSYQPISTTKGVFAGVISGDGKTTVYAYVAIGEGYVSQMQS